MKNEKLKKAKIREEKGRMIEGRRTLKPLQKEVAEKRAQKMFDTLDLQTPPDQTDKVSESAMQASPPRFASPLDMQWKSPNGDPFDNMYWRQKKN